MTQLEFHVMQAVLIEERATTRYSCLMCERCVEDGPDGLTIVHRGDQRAMHRGGSLTGIAQTVDQPAQGKPQLH